jgi:DNA-nicking Smr family endonuclease
MSPRRLSDDERALWKGVIRSIAPLRRRLPPEPDDTAAPPAAPAPKMRAKPRPGPRPAPTADVASPAQKPAPQPLTRRTKKRIARGTHAIDGRLDLHGLTQDEAHSALLSFLRGRQARGGRLVLVITGKGGRDGGGGGVLRRMVPLWLELPELRSMVIGFESAAVGHGGEGALYVRLRKTSPADLL